MVYEGGTDPTKRFVMYRERDIDIPVCYSLPGSDDWKYSMRRTMQEIIPNLFLGPYSAAVKSKLNDLKSHGITHIICVRHTLEANFIKPNFEDQFKYLVLEMADSSEENIIHYFPMVKEFIDECFESGGKMLVHGNAGISRSGALVIAYVMETLSLSFADAHELVLQKRFCVNLNKGFINQLREYEAIYRAQRELAGIQPSSVKGRYKRTCDQIEDI